jgi:hypothetical protein
MQVKINSLISARNLNGIRKYFRVFIRALGAIDLWKKWRSKISWDCLFKFYEILPLNIQYTHFSPLLWVLEWRELPPIARQLRSLSEQSKIAAWTNIAEPEGAAHRYLMSRLSLQVFYLWRHVSSTAPPLILWWSNLEIQFGPLHRSSPFIGELRCQAIQTEHVPYIAERTQKAVYIVSCLWCCSVSDDTGVPQFRTFIRKGWFSNCNALIAKYCPSEWRFSRNRRRFQLSIDGSTMETSTALRVLITKIGFNLLYNNLPF